MKLVLLFLMIIFIIPTVLGLESYNNTGTTDQQYVSGIGAFNENIVTDSITSATFTSLTNIPLVADLDGDGVNEIIIIDGNDVLLRDTDLATIDGFTLEGGTYSNPIITDIDKDGLAEIIIGHELSGNISILEYDGVSFIRQAFLEYNLPTITGTNEIMLNCGDDQGLGESISCLIVSASSPIASGTRDFSYAGFNASNVGSTTQIITSGNTLKDYCLPAIQSISYSDFDSPTGDTRKEFIFTVTEFDSAINEKLRILYIDVAESLVTTEDQQTIFESGFNPVTTNVDCATDNIGKFYTSPLVEDIDGIQSNGKETIIGINEDSQDFVMKVFRANGNDINTHPAVFQADGTILSNPILSNVFGDTGNVEYCVLGHATSDSDCGVNNQCLDLLCGSSTTTNIFETVEFKFDTSGRFNVSQSFNDLNIISHGVQNSNLNINIAGEGLIDTTDYLTTYGVFRLSDETFNGSFFIKSLDIIYDELIDDATCIQVNAQKTQPETEDIICLTSTQLFYIDDGISNQPAVVDDITFNPCVVDSIIKVNSTLQVLVTITDQNTFGSQDLVSSIVTVYKNDGNSVNSTVSNTTSGELHPHSFTLNKTITGGVIEVQGFDSFDESIIDIQTQTFTVAENGIEFGDSTCIVDFITPLEDVPVDELLNISVSATANEGVTDFISGASNTFKVSPIVLIIFLMLGWTIAVLTTSGGVNSSMISMNKVIFMLVGNAFIFILGAIVGAVPFGVLLVLIILGLFAIIIWARRTFTSMEA